MIRTKILLALAVVLSPLLFAADPVTPMTPDGVASYDKVRPEADFIKRVQMIPMRDGIKLYTVIVMKKGTRNAPILLSRTPYDAKGETERTGSQSITEIMPAMDAEFVADNYIRVYQDIRGMHNSEGEYVTNRPIRGPLNDTGIDESTDAYDTIDWLVKHTPESNGKVGIVGSSYLGFTSLMAEIDPHPALKAAVPESPMVDGWMGDDWFHNGAFRNTNINYSVEQGTAKAENGDDVAVGAGDDYTRFLEAGSTGDYINKWGFDRYPFIQKLTRNPAFIPRPIDMGDANQWKPWLVHDQRFASSRPDVLLYATDVLDKPVHIMGQPIADLFAATSGSDGDWVVKLIDVYPNTSTEGTAQGAVGPEMAGFELPIGIEIFRGRYVHGFDKPQALTPDKVEEYRFGLPHVDHVFLPGHKIMVQVQSSLFPLYDRNPQTFVDNIFYAQPQDYQKATVKIYHSAAAASAVELPVVGP